MSGNERSFLFRIQTETGWCRGKMNKSRSRKKKEDLINSINAEWKDLYDEIKYL